MPNITKPPMLNETGVSMNETMERMVISLQSIAESQRRQADESSAVHYGIRINKNDSNPATRMTYMYDCVSYIPSHMDYTNGKFDYGSWGDAFFVKNNYPAMVTFDGHEDYKLNKADQRYKEDGVTPSDISDETYNGNAMSVFDCKIWLYMHEDENYEYIEVSNVKLNENFHDYGYVRSDGSHADKLYYPMFFGYKDSNGKLRSIADKAPWNNTGGAQNEINAAVANGSHWNIGDWAHRIVLKALLLLMGLSDNSQTVYGQGQTSGYVNDSSVNYGHLKTGTLKDKGQFFGYSDTSHDVKVFFTENGWGNSWNRTLGLINDHGVYKYKLTPPYNLTGSGYDSITGVTVPSGNWQKQTKTGIFGRLPLTTGSDGASSLYTCDYFWSNNGQVGVALVGGSCFDGAYCGVSCLSLDNAAGSSGWSIGASPHLEQP